MEKTERKNSENSSIENENDESVTSERKVILKWGGKTVSAVLWKQCILCLFKLFISIKFTIPEYRKITDKFIERGQTRG